RQRKEQEAIASFRQALRCKPDYAEAHGNLGNVLKEQGYVLEAADCFREVLRLKSDDAEAAFHLASLSGAGTPAHAPPPYAEHLVDAYAPTFDADLKTLGYRAPQLLREAVLAASGQGPLDILDLGCGTGLCGPLFKDMARTLTGVDLSARMLAKARARGVYDE